MMPSAIDQRTSVLAKRKTKTERGVGRFCCGDALERLGHSRTIRNDPAKGKRRRQGAARCEIIALRRRSISFDAVSKTMQALVKRNPEPGLGLEEVPVPEIGPNDVLIRVQKGIDLRDRRTYI